MTINAASEGLPEPIPASTVSFEYAVGENLISEAAYCALQDFSAATDDRRAFEHPLRVAVILNDFAEGLATRGMYDAAALHDVGQRVCSGDPYQAEAQNSLCKYASTISTSGEAVSAEWRYTSTLLADMDKIELCSQRGRRVDTGEDVVSGLLRSRSDIQVPHYAWGIQSGLVGLHRIEELLQNVNLESVLVKSAEMLDNLQHPAPKDRTVLQNIFDAESFYAPLCEAIGFDGLSMALRSEAAIIRLQRSGKQFALDNAQDLLTGLGERGKVLANVTGLFQHILRGEAILEAPIHDNSGHGIIIGQSVLDAHELNGGKNTLWALWRVKSLGSLALKQNRLGEKPSDVLGITIVVDDLQELVMTYKGVVECIKANNVVEENPSPNHRLAYSIQGSDEYIDSVSNGFNNNDNVYDRDFEIVRKGNGHQVAKTTFIYKPDLAGTGTTETDIAVELQVQTITDWLASRTGSAAHLLYKAGIFRDHTVLEAINKRRAHLNSARLNPRSQESGKRFRSLVAS